MTCKLLFSQSLPIRKLKVILVLFITESHNLSKEYSKMPVYTPATVDIAVKAHFSSLDCVVSKLLFRLMVF